MTNNSMTAKVDYQSIDSSNSPEVGDSLVFNADFFCLKKLERIKSVFRDAQTALCGSGFTCSLSISEELFSSSGSSDWGYSEAYLVAGLNYSDNGGDVFVTQKLVGKYDSADFVESEAISLDALIDWVKKNKIKAA